MITGKYEWGLGAKVGLPIAVAIVLIGLILTALCIRWAMTDRRNYNSDTVVSAWTFGLFTAAVAGISLVCYFPFTPARDYHAWNEVVGTVEASNTRLISDGNHGVSQRYVIKFAEDPTLYGCDDTRCSLAAQGKHVRLMCKKEWEFSAVTGWACRYGQAS